MHELEASGAVTGCQEWIVCVRFAVAYPADIATALRRLTAAGAVPCVGQHPGRIPFRILNVRGCFAIGYRHFRCVLSGWR